MGGDEPRWFANPSFAGGARYPADLERIMDAESARHARAEIETWPGYATTPLVDLPGLARYCGVGRVLYKDEGPRFGLGSFKALGGAYAVYRYVADALMGQMGQMGQGRTSAPSSAELLSGRFRAQTAGITVCCATDGNHGRAVAWGARLFGVRCIVYVHETVSQTRADAIASYGAQVVRHPGNYDETVNHCAAQAERNGWTVVSDTSWEGYTAIPRDVMHGYTLMCDEVIEQLATEGDEALPTHVMVQGGVGAIAAAVCARLWWAYGARRPRFAVVEPARAACILESARAGRRVTLTGDIETVMAGLSCGEPSLIAWDILHRGATDLVAIGDDRVGPAMRVLADGIDGDTPIVAGESAVAGIATLLAARERPSLYDDLGLDAGSRVLVFGTEGDTDPDNYRRLVGRSADEVRGR